MAHRLIALLFSSVQYTTSPCMKPTRPVHHHHTPEILFSSPSISCNTFISLRPTARLSFRRPSPSLFCSLAHPLYLCFCPPLCIRLSFCLSVFLCCCSKPPRLISLPLLVLSLVQMCPWSVVAWLGDNRSDFETGGWQPCCHWHTELFWWAFNCILTG